MKLLHIWLLLCSAAAPVAQIISSIRPRGGPVTGGTTVTVEGKDLDSITQCVFGEERVPAAVESDRLATCVSPDIPVGEVETPKDFRVTTRTAPLPDEASPFRFQYYINPHVDSITPNGGRQGGGGIVVAEGTGFDAFENGSPAAKCKFGTEVGNVTAIQDYGRQLECTVPSGIKTGPVKFTIALNGQNFVAGNSEAKFYAYSPNPAPSGFRAWTPPPTPPPTLPPTPSPPPPPKPTPNVTLQPSPPPPPPPIGLKVIASTTVAARSAPGSRIIYVNSTAGFGEAQAVRVNAGQETEEDARVLGTKDNHTLVLDKPLKFYHSAKEIVYCYVSPAKPNASRVRTAVASPEQRGSQAETADSIKLYQPSTVAAAVFFILIVSIGVLFVAGWAVNRYNGKTGFRALPLYGEIVGSLQAPPAETQPLMKNAY